MRRSRQVENSVMLASTRRAEMKRKYGALLLPSADRPRDSTAGALAGANEEATCIYIPGIPGVLPGIFVVRANKCKDCQRDN